MKELTTKEENTLVTLINEKINECTKDINNCNINLLSDCEDSTKRILINIINYNKSLIDDLIVIRDKIIDL